VGDTVSGHFDRVGDAVSGHFDHVGDVMSGHFDHVGDVMSSRLDQMGDMVTGLATGLSKHLGLFCTVPNHTGEVIQKLYCNYKCKVFFNSLFLDQLKFDDLGLPAFGGDMFEMFGSVRKPWWKGENVCVNR
jgi:hypothetical protein